MNEHEFSYRGDVSQRRWDFELCSICSEALMFDLLDAGIIDIYGKVNYEISL